MAFISDINGIFNKYYQDNPELKEIVKGHSERVAQKALCIAKDKNLDLDPRDIYSAAMLHDIGVVKCNAPDIFARGDSNYLLHGIEGEKILLSHGLLTYAGVCSHHTGAGITKEEIIKNNLPLPHIDLLPRNLLEELICYADKFYSKSGDIHREKSLDQVIKSISKYGNDSLLRFMSLHAKFS